MGPVRSHFAKSYCNGKKHCAILTTLNLYLRRSVLNDKRKPPFQKKVFAFLVARIKSPCNDRRVWKTNEEMYSVVFCGHKAFL